MCKTIKLFYFERPLYIFYILKIEKVGKDSKNLIYYQLISMVKGRFFK